MKLKRYLNLCAFTIFGIFPFWVLLTYQIRDMSTVAGALFSSLKYILVIFFVVLSFFLSVGNRDRTGKSRPISLSFYQLPAIFYFCWVVVLSLWSFNSILIFDVLRIQIIPIALGVFLLINLRGRFDAYQLLKSVVNYSLFVSFTALAISIIEYFHQDILVSLYRTEISELGHADTSFGKRLLSIYENPINFGAAICLSFACFSYLLVKWRNKASLSFSIWLIIALSFILLALTLSRTAFAVGALVLLLVTIQLAKYKKITPIVILVTLIGFALLGSLYYFDEIAFLVKRIDSLASLNTYTENARVENWAILFSHFDVWVYIFAGLGAGKSNPDGELALTQGTYVVENAFISNLVDFGLIGLFFYVLIILRFTYCAFKIKQPDAKLFFKVFVLVFFIFSLANDFNRNQPFSFYFWFLYFLAESALFQDNYSIKKGAVGENSLLSYR